MLVKKFGEKYDGESKKAIKLQTVLSKKFNDILIIEKETIEKGLEFVDNLLRYLISEKGSREEEAKLKQKTGVQLTLMSGGMNCIIELHYSAIQFSRSYFCP